MGVKSTRSSLPASELGAARGRGVIDRGVNLAGADAVGLGSVLVTFGNAKSPGTKMPIDKDPSCVFGRAVGKAVSSAK
jgi:hypothetical protein